MLTGLLWSVGLEDVHSEGCMLAITEIISDASTGTVLPLTAQLVAGGDGITVDKAMGWAAEQRELSAKPLSQGRLAGLGCRIGTWPGQRIEKVGMSCNRPASSDVFTEDGGQIKRAAIRILVSRLGWGKEMHP